MKKILNQLGKTTLIAVLIFLSTNTIVESKTIFIQDKYGNVQGTIKPINKKGDYQQTDKYGNNTRTYRQHGNIIYIYDKYGNCIGSFRK